MNELRYEYRVEVVLVLTRKELEQIASVSAVHYDSRCKQFGAKEIADWQFMGSGYTLRPDWTEVEITVTWDQADIIAKILEQEHRVQGVNLFGYWIAMFKRLRDESERINAPHRITDEFYSMAYRDELRRKYGEPSPKPDTVISTKNFEFSHSIVEKLTSAGVKTISQLVTKLPADLMAINGFTVTDLSEVEHLLALRGKTLGTVVKNIRPECMRCDGKEENQ